MTFITHGFQWYRTYERGYEISGSPLRFMLRRSSLVECVSVLHGTGVYKASIFFSSTVCSAMFVKNPKYIFYTIKSSLKLAYQTCSYIRILAIQNSLKCMGTLQIFIHLHWYFILDTGLLLRSIELFIYIQTCVNVNRAPKIRKNMISWRKIVIFHTKYPKNDLPPLGAIF
jgi:hypothetical protein